jgi:hypothetical protein
MAMKRTTIMADDGLLEQLRAIARDEGISLGEVIRQGLEWRANARTRIPSFLSKPPFKLGPPHDTASRADEFIAEYVRKKHARY